jgi:AraC-like DNA-binding protein
MSNSRLLFIRSAALTGYHELATEFGITPNALLRSLSIDPRAGRDPDQLISLRSYVSLLDLSAELAKCPDFGLRLSQGWGIKTLGPIGLLALNEPDVEQALLTISKYLYLHNEGLRLTVDVLDELSRLSCHIDIDVAAFSSTRQSMDLSVGGGVNILRLFLGDGWNPLEAYFTHSAPADTSLYRRIFRAPVYFNQEFNGLTFKTEQLNKPLRAADDLMRKYLLRYITSLDNKHGDDIVSKTRRIICDLLSSGRCSKAMIAGYLSMNPRTMQRKLHEHGYNFKQLTEETRATLAAQHLTDSRKPITEIAELLGYSDLSAFSRFFQRVHGVSPSNWRRNSKTK